MSCRFGCAALPVLLQLALAPLDAQAPRLVRSLSGPSGKVVGSTFVFDSTRSRFVYPQDSSLTVYFEWEAQPGMHVLTGIWKQPDGKVATISPDIKIESPGRALNCYWIFSMTPGLPNGVWTLEVRIDGQPSGSHPFEIAGMVEPKPEPAVVLPVTPKQPTLDEVYNAVRPSLVWIRKLDDSGRTTDSTTGFVFQQNRVVTAFQSIEGAGGLQVEFSSGRKAPVESIIVWSRTGDWAVLKTDTGSASPLLKSDATVRVGERLIVFNVDGPAREMGGVDIVGRQGTAAADGRIQISPAVATSAAGGPLLDVFGHVVGILGCNVSPCVRYSGTATSVSLALWQSFSTQNAAAPISSIPQNLTGEGRSLEDLRVSGILSPAVAPMPELLYAGSSNILPPHGNDTLPRDISDFSRKDDKIWVISLWAKRGKLSKGQASVTVHDAQNQLRVKPDPRKLSLMESPQRLAFGFSPSALSPGVYRVDLCWEGSPVWRTYIRIAE